MLVDSSRLFALIGLQIAWKEIGGGTLEIYVVSGLGGVSKICKHEL